MSGLDDVCGIRDVLTSVDVVVPGPLDVNENGRTHVSTVDARPLTAHTGVGNILASLDVPLSLRGTVEWAFDPTGPQLTSHTRGTSLKPFGKDWRGSTS